MHTTKPETVSRQAPLHEVDVIDARADGQRVPWMNEHLRHRLRASDFCDDAVAITDFVAYSPLKVCFEREFKFTLRSRSTVDMSMAASFHGIDRAYNRHIIGSSFELRAGETKEVCVTSTRSAGFGIGRLVLVGFIVEPPHVS